MAQAAMSKEVKPAAPAPLAGLARTPSKLVTPDKGLGLERAPSAEAVGAAGAAMDLELPCITQTLRAGQASVKGARSRNEDCHGLQEVQSTGYAFIYVCDGHGGPNLAKKMGECFDAAMMETVPKLSKDASPAEMVDLMREQYERAVVCAELERGGTTFTAGLLQLTTMIFASLQLGDSLVGACDTKSGKLCDASVLMYLDDSGCQVGPAHDVTITRAHAFTDPVEVERYRKVLKKHAGLGLRVDKRTDCHPLEDRCLADVTGATNVGLPEPSRTVQCKVSYTESVFHELQRCPEFVVWQLPMDREICVFAVCDGFESKLAMPSTARMAECMCDPGTYLEGDNFHGTVFEACNVVHVDAAWKRLTTAEKLAQIRDRTTLPDREWQDAHEYSCDALLTLLDKFKGKLPTMSEDPQVAVEAAVNTAVVLLSDDNVTAEVLVVQPN